MEPLKNLLPSVLDRPTSPSSASGPLTPSSANSEKLAKVAIAADRILRGRPEIRTENPDYLDGLTETLETLSDQELAWINDPRDGVAARCKYLPTPADIFELIREKQAALAKVQPTHTAYKRLEPEPEPVEYENDDAQRKRTVKTALGYNPNDRRPAQKITPMTDDEIRETLAKSPYRDAPISAEMREFLARECRV